MTRRTKFDRASTPRGAFTVMELMVVITIIAALAALTASAVMKYIEVQQTNNTQSTLDRVQSQLSKAWSKVKDDAYKAPMNEIVPGTSTTIEQWIQSSLAGSDANAAGRTRILYLKLKLRQAFPMNFNEALNPYPLPPLQGYVKYLNNLGVTASSGAAYESSACLLMALQRGVSGAGIDPSELTKGGAAGNANGIPYLTDGWGRPIYFTRVPAGNLNLNPGGSAIPNSVPNVSTTATTIYNTCYSLPGANDMGDPQGYLQTTQWGQTYGTMFSTLTLQPLATGNSSFKLAPMLASGGSFNWMKQGATPGFSPPGFDPITFSQFVYVPPNVSPPSGGMLYGPGPNNVGSVYLMATTAMFSTP